MSFCSFRKEDEAEMKGQQVQNNCGLFEMELTAPDGTTISPGDPKYDKQDNFRLIMIDASGFEVSATEYECYCL